MRDTLFDVFVNIHNSEAHLYFIIKVLMRLVQISDSIQSYHTVNLNGIQRDLRPQQPMGILSATPAKVG